MDEQLPKIERYRDYREMLEKQKDIDGIIVATPDHMHAPIASAAMDLGKHVYVQKPLCWSVEEARTLAKKAKEHPKIVTQMGNQGHSRDEARLGYEYITSGAIGDVREVHVWTNRPLGYWPQGFRVRRRCLPVFRTRRQRIRAGKDRTSTTRLAAAMVGNYTIPAINCRGISSSASRRRSITTRFITRSTGAAGSTGVRVRSATWART